MPTVPVYSGQQVRQAAMPGQNVQVHATADAFGARQARALGQVAEGLSSAGSLLMEIQAKAKERDDKILAGSAYNAAALEAQKAMQDSVYAKEGAAAIDSEEVAKKSMEEIRAKYMSQLKSSRQKELFSASFDHDAANNMGNAVTHWGRQSKVAEDINRSTMNQLAIDRAMGSALGNTPSVATDIAEAERVLVQNTVAKFKVDPTLGKLEAQKAVGLLHQQIADGYAKAGRYDDALNHLDANKAKLDPVVAAKVVGDVQYRKDQGTILGMVQEGKSEDEIAQHIMGATKDPARADDLMRYAKTFLSARERERAAQTEQAIEGAWSRLEASGNPADIDPRLPRKVRHDMEKYLQEGATAKDADYEQFERLMGLSEPELVTLAKNQEALSEARLALGGGKSKEWNALHNRIIKATGGKVDEKKEAEAEGFLSDQGLATNMFNTKFLSLAEKGDLDKKQEAAARSKFLVAYNQKLAEAQRQAGDKPLDLAVKQKIAGRMLLFGEWDPGVMTTGRNLFKYEVEQEGLDLADWQGEADTGAPQEIAGGREVVVDGQRFRKKPEGSTTEPEIKMVKQRRQAVGGGGITIEGAK